VKARLSEGSTLDEAELEFALTRTVIRQLSFQLDAEQRKQREQYKQLREGRSRAERFKSQIARPAALNPGCDPHYASILSALPRGMDPSLADDAAQDAYLAMLEGRLKEADSSSGVRKFANSNYGRFANKWGNLSLDEPIGDEGRTYADALEDPAALEAFELIGADED
jgi:hypothetical protein